MVFMDAAYGTLKGAILLYSDYELRILLEKRGKAKTRMQAELAAYETVRQRARGARERLESWKHTGVLLKKATDPVEIAELQALLGDYPLEEDLRHKAKVVASEEAEARAAYNGALEVYKNAVAKVNNRRAFVIWVDETYGTSLTRICEQFGSIELICRYDKVDRNLDVFFGGRNKPNGYGHAHWVFNRQGETVYSRNPKVKRAKQQA